MNDPARETLARFGVHLACATCKSIVKPPVVRYPCHLFCEDCIEEKGSRCPCCDKPGASVLDEKLGTLSSLYADLKSTLSKTPAHEEGAAEPAGTTSKKDVLIGGQSPDPSARLGAFSWVPGTEDKVYLSQDTAAAENEGEDPQTPLSSQLVNVITRSASRAMRSMFGRGSAPIAENDRANTTEPVVLEDEAVESDKRGKDESQADAGDKEKGKENPVSKRTAQRGLRKSAASEPAKRKDVGKRRDGNLKCAMCHQGEDYQEGALGPIVDFSEPNATSNRRFLVHKDCALWAPDVFEDADAVQGLRNVAKEVRRASMLKCVLCKKNGAALGCAIVECASSYHYACARTMASANLDRTNFLFTCPRHNKKNGGGTLTKTPTKKRTIGSGIRASASSKRARKNPGESWKAKQQNWVFVGSNIENADRSNALKLAVLSGSLLKSDFQDGVTHVICGVDEKNLARRSSKYIMGILHGCWIVTPEWVNKCLEQCRDVSEEPYEVQGDTLSGGRVNGARLGRLRKEKGEPKLLAGKQVFLSGTIDKKPCLELAVQGAGATLLSKLPPPSSISTLVILHDSAHSDGPLEHHGVKSIDFKKFLWSVSLHRFP